MSSKYKPSDEWFKQAEYDLQTADAMFKTGRCIYTVFMCHLSVEKALKGLYAKRSKKDPPRIHNLNYFCEKIDIEIPSEQLDFIDNLNNLSVPTRYPDELERLLKDYKKENTGDVLKRTKELLKCLKQWI
jgi:HEPN domain-containing protein